MRLANGDTHKCRVRHGESAERIDKKGGTARPIRVILVFMGIKISKTDLALGAVVLLFFAGLFAHLTVPLFDNDFWWHLATGKWMWQHGAIIQADPFDFPSYPQDFPVYTGFFLKQYWLSQLMMYGVYSAAGFAGLIVLRAAVMTLMFYTLYQTAIEGVGDAAAHLDSLQGRQHLVVCLAHMQQGRQSGVTRDAQLRFEQQLLPLPIQSGDEVVQADLAHGDRTMRAQPLLQCGDIRVLVPLEVDRVQTQGGIEFRPAAAQGNQAGPARPIDTRHDNGRHSRLAGKRQDFGPIRIEIGNVEMAMRVDELHGAVMSRASAPS